MPDKKMIHMLKIISIILIYLYIAPNGDTKEI